MWVDPQLWTLHLVNFVKFLSTLLGVATHCCNISDSSRSATHLSNSPLSFLPWFYSTKMPLLFAQNRAQMLMISRATLVNRWRGPEGLLVDGSDFFFECSDGRWMSVSVWILGTYYKGCLKNKKKTRKNLKNKHRKLNNMNGLL